MVDILSVDDDEGIRTVIKRLLSREGYNVETVESGEKCIEFLKERKFDIILMDVMMPGLNGWETLKIIKENPDTSDIPVIMVTVKASQIDKEISFRDLADGHVGKPIEKEELFAAISWTLMPGF